MEDNLNRYFADEFNSEEKIEFLMMVENNEELKEEFIEKQNLLALIDWVSSEYENKQEYVQQKLREFMYKMNETKNK
ncbi:hypothetical protein [Bacteroides sp. D2]|uniref:hypothetical protein n=1 Tax=unclassified Bacteroides TaxID=2646097 RepID=UPI0001BC79DE|nr:hypothetical protein [Bacteroides sp. D2]EFS30821.1 hypothetical protein BSGG_1521 [Bacteroides sp. D2]UWO01821.1 anti-sigma factor [Bacteroides sp. D2]